MYVVVFCLLSESVYSGFPDLLYSKVTLYKPHGWSVLKLHCLVVICVFRGLLGMTLKVFSYVSDILKLPLYECVTSLVLAGR